MVNDCHVHLGIMGDIGKESTISSIIKLKQKVENMLVFPSDVCVEQSHTSIRQLQHLVEGVYGLSWGRYIEGFYGVKYHGSYLNKPVTSLPIEDLEKLSGKILLVHCGMYKEGDVESNTSYLHALDLAEEYPNINVILGHMGGSVLRVIEKALNAATDLKNVYFETSGITTPLAVEMAVRKVGSDRILFGSDYPWCSFNAMYHNVNDANISDGDKQRIFYDNFL